MKKNFLLSISTIALSCSLLAGCGKDKAGLKMALICLHGESSTYDKNFIDAFKAAADTKAESLVKKQAKLVTIKGVTIKTAGDNGYYNWELDGKTSYTRISSSTCPLTKAQQATFAEEYSKHLGWVADVAGIITVYSGAFYLTPVDANAVK